MNRFKILLFLFFFFIFCFGARNSKSYNLISYAERNLIVAKGATSITELGNSVLQAIQEHNFDQLSNFILNDQELATLKRTGSEDLKAVIQNITAEELQNNLKASYETVIQDGIGRTINWTEYVVAESRAGKANTNNKLLQPVIVNLYNKQHQSVQVAFEAIKVNNRYFLFQQMQLR